QLNTFVHCFRLHELGYPTFNILPHAPEIFLEDERRAAEPFFSVLALLGGTHVIRSPEVRTVRRIRQAMDLYESGTASMPSSPLEPRAWAKPPHATWLPNTIRCSCIITRASQPLRHCRQN